MARKIKDKTLLKRKLKGLERENTEKRSLDVSDSDSD